MSSWIESFATYTFIHLSNNILSIVFLPKIFIWLLVTNKYLLEKNLPKHFCDTLFFPPEFTGQMVHLYAASFEANLHCRENPGCECDLTGSHFHLFLLKWRQYVHVKNYKEINEALDENRAWKLIRQGRDPKATPFRKSLLQSRDEEVTSASLSLLLLNNHLCPEAVHQDASQAIRRHMDTHGQSWTD